MRQPNRSVNYNGTFCHENSGNRSSFRQTPQFAQDQYANSMLAAHNKIDLSADPRQNQSDSAFPSRQWYVPQDSENNVPFAAQNTVRPLNTQPQRTDKMTKASRQKAPYSRPRPSAAASSSVGTSTGSRVLAGTSALWEYCRLSGAPDQCRWRTGHDTSICGFALNGCQVDIDANRHLVDAHGSKEQTVAHPNDSTNNVMLALLLIIDVSPATEKPRVLRTAPAIDSEPQTEKNTKLQECAQVMLDHR
ncbi:hypothetical protein K435DRAFT_851220 [Dendrothele bispora CBS 962.96]|uniref:Uncharacterized protein n=1 Tax=Dendrothele bispora (strain CBS 962.96) TaxID=1314807 RepID=A0A4S8MMC4_DENBC|nr:hypothetical protein K435DRAFT_851220 [Dendrothele bispora CBS 962.96]